MSKKNKKSELALFKEFVERAGAEILSPTSEYEALRFKANYKIGVVYKNGQGSITSYTGEAKEARQAFLDKKEWSAARVIRRVSRNIIFRTLLERDGSDCFYCGIEMKEGEETIEHLFSINQGGKNHVANLALAHAECNLKAASLPIVKKIKLRDRLREDSQILIFGKTLKK